LLHKQQVGEGLEIAIVGDRKDGAQPRQIDISRSHVVMGWHGQPRRIRKRAPRRLSRKGEHRLLCGQRTLVDKVLDDALRFADDRGVRLAGEVADRR
jgi:hypothetical protein